MSQQITSDFQQPERKLLKRQARIPCRSMLVGLSVSSANVSTHLLSAIGPQPFQLAKSCCHCSVVQCQSMCNGMSGVMVHIACWVMTAGMVTFWKGLFCAGQQRGCMLMPNSARIGSRQPRHSRSCGLPHPPVLLCAMPQTSFSVSRYHMALLELSCCVFSATGTCHGYNSPVVAHRAVAPVHMSLRMFKKACL